VESGCLSGARSSDSYYLKKISGSPHGVDLINTYTFEAPLAPGVAAQLEGVEISLDKILESYRRLERLHDHVLVEGAGGLMVPLSGEQSLLDLIACLGLPVLLVGRLSLGTINHTLLSLECLSQRKIPVAGVVLNSALKKQDLSAQYNHTTLSQWSSVPLWGVVDFIPKLKNRETIVEKIRYGIGEAADRYFKIAYDS
jgi:dethiobiotin synthetase